MNKTQCPHCFTVYVISDEQVRLSQGMVRCGTCRERFEARLVSTETAPRFDSTEAFIEPLSEIEPATELRPDDFIEEEPDFTFKKIGASNESLNPATFSNNLYEFNDSLNSEMSIEIDDDAAQDMGAEEIGRLEQAIHQQLKLPERDKHVEPISKAAVHDELERPLDDALINEVDRLIDNKILLGAAAQGANPSKVKGREGASPLQALELAIDELATDDSPAEPLNASVASDAFALDSKKRLPLVVRVLAGLLLLILMSVFAGALVYQLWLKQKISWPDNTELQQTLSPLVSPLIEPLIEPIKKQLDAAQVELPIRRNLSQLELVSAITEAHPTRPSTVLLRVSLINHAPITQPLPWLEMSLTDADGRMISRRNLAPQDYVYNNRVDGQIGAKQLKRVTVELLAFPKLATGYEIRLLSK